MEDISLSNFIKYCLGYIKLTRQRSFIAQSKISVKLSKDIFNINDLLECDIDSDDGKLVNLETFYSFDPKEVTEESEKKYNEEQSLAKKIDEIYNKGRNDPYTKQIVFNFGYYEIEIPIEEDIDLNPDYLEEENNKPLTKIDRYPLFSLPVTIEKIFEGGSGKYYIKPTDSEIQVNIGILTNILGEDLYSRLIGELGKYEMEDDLSLPINSDKIFIDVWNKIGAQLKLTDVNFGENSFILDEMQVGIGPRVNYFIADDLQNLSKLEDDDFGDTSLMSWIENEDSLSEEDTPKEGELYFPFLYDEHQLRTLSVIGNKASIVQGPPGTGKSQTISNIICHLAAKGKKVLFVSQKEQALKVVKDMLKNLGVEYLFGYIPDIGSMQLNEDDKLDGIAPRLAALESHIDKIGFKIYPRRKHSVISYKTGTIKKVTDEQIQESVKDRVRLKKLFNKTIDSQREYWNLIQELEKLKLYNLEISNTGKFNHKFSDYLRKEVNRVKREIGIIKNQVGLYEQNKKRSDFDKLFSDLNLKKKDYSKLVSKIIDDITTSGYDGHNKFVRLLKNNLLKWRLKDIRSSLPREFVDYIDGFLEKDLSKSKLVKELKELLAYCLYYERQHNLKNLEKTLDVLLSDCGLSYKEFETIDKIISKEGFNKVKNNILRVIELSEKLNQIKIKDPNSISDSLNKTGETYRERIKIYLQNIINGKIIDKYREGMVIRSIVRKLAKAFDKSKRAYKTFDKLREDPSNFSAIMDFIPVWIMELDDASRIVPLESSIFDYVIFDESSQCNIAYAIPAMYRAKRAIFVGDSEQMRDSTIMFKSNRSFDELAQKFQIPEDLQIKATGEAVQSILDIARLRGFQEIPLRNHYRSPKELIDFSNDYFYKPKGKELIVLNNNYLTYRNTNRVIIIHPVEVDINKEIAEKVNVSEAEKILDFFRKLRSDKQYQDKSIGILSFFNAQATYLRELFEKEGYKEEVDNYKIGIIEGIQGDEKDIIIYSFVIQSPDQKNRYIPLTGEGGDIRAGINKGRVNVAFSRARLQSHCFISMPIEEIPKGIWIKRYLEYARDNGKVDFYSVKINLFDSKFEEDFYNFMKSKLSNKEYRIQNQVKSCGFKIDFVITNTKTSKKLAIECDGPTHFKNEIDEELSIYIENDEQRQRILESAGWDFYRIKYSDWINNKFDRKVVVKNISKMIS